MESQKKKNENKKTNKQTTTTTTKQKYMFPSSSLAFYFHQYTTDDTPTVIDECGFSLANIYFKRYGTIRKLNLVHRVQRLVARRDSGEIEKNIILIGCPITTCIVLPQKPCGNKILGLSLSLASDQSLTKQPENSGFEIDNAHVLFG